MARNGQLLTQGRARMDLAVYMHNYAYPSVRGDSVGHWNDRALQEAGYTWDYLSPALLSLPAATVSNGRLAEEGPAYKALIFNAQLWPPINTARGDLTVEMAERFIEYAEDGLPIVFVGELPGETPGYDPEHDAQLQTLVAQLAGMANVHQASAEAGDAGIAWNRAGHATEPAIDDLQRSQVRCGNRDELLLPLQPGKPGECISSGLRRAGNSARILGTGALRGYR